MLNREAHLVLQLPLLFQRLRIAAAISARERPHLLGLVEEERDVPDDAARLGHDVADAQGHVQERQKREQCGHPVNRVGEHQHQHWQRPIVTKETISDNENVSFRQRRY